MNFNDLEKKYNNFNSKCLYLDKNIREDGINYNQYYKLRFESFNLSHIKKYYTPIGWYLMWYLTIKSDTNYRTITTLSIIKHDTGLKDEKIKEALNILKDIKVIIIDNKVKQIRKETPLIIYTLYQDDEYYGTLNLTHKGSSITGYKAIPIQYLKIIFSELDYKRLTVYLALYSSFNYYTIKEGEAPSDNTIMNTCYSFLTHEKISENTDIPVTSVWRSLKELNNSKKNLININKYGGYRTVIIDDEVKVLPPNNIYEVTILCRTEYIYYHIWNIPDTRDKETINKIRKFKLEDIVKTNNYKYIIPLDFIYEHYKETMKQYSIILKEQDQEKYNSIGKTILSCI